ncbi:MAG: replication-associated recombination protein A [Puniceicoccales bacterium]|jgi:putative ATPase|nr:replication-associated recombination protein A [Puniceicoccales bacterium]
MRHQCELWSAERQIDGDHEFSHGQPLAIRMRPRNLGEVIGQNHILGPNCMLPRLVRRNCFGSIIFFGPPGSGKTSLAEAIGAETGSKILRINAVTSNLAELRSVLQSARLAEQAPIVFIDEIHRFNRAQQDSLLPDVERGTIRLIGATTYTPTTYVISPLLSRSHLFRLEPLPNDRVRQFLRMTLEDCERGLGSLRCRVDDEVLEAIAATCQGDLRRALNSLETLVLGAPMGTSLTIDDWKTFATERHINYDRDGSEHHATISAHIKSMRGCDPDSAIYWLTKMLRGGEDPRFIARRLVIFASEDVGLADPHALPLASACYAACETIGMPECAINLAHVTVYLATAPKSNSAYAAYDLAGEDIDKNGAQTVPDYLRNQPQSLQKRLCTDHYIYAHGHMDNVTGQKHMTNPRQFYFPNSVGAEAKIVERLERITKLRNNFDGPAGEQPP